MMAICGDSIRLERTCRMLKAQIENARKKVAGLDKKIDQIILVTITQFMNRILEEAISNVSSPLINARASYSIEIDKANVVARIYNKNDMIAYFEFGTGNPETVKKGLSAAEYLKTQPAEVRAAAMKFFVTGEGTIPAQPHLFPAYYKYRDQIIPEIERRVQQLLDRI